MSTETDRRMGIAAVASLRAHCTIIVHGPGSSASVKLSL
jgi:hypothetical protein